MNFLPYILFWLVGRVLGDLKNLKPDFLKLVKDVATRDDKLPIMLGTHEDLRNPVQIHATNYLRKPVQTDITFYLQKPVQVDSSHDLRKIVKVSDSHDLRRSPIHRPDHDLRNLDEVRIINNLHEPVKTDSTFHLGKPVQADLSHDLREVIKISHSHDRRWPTVRESDHDLRKPVQVHATNDLRKPVKTDSTFYLQKPVQVDSSHNLRRVVEVSDSHGIRLPTVRESDHDLRKPAQVHATNDLRKPVQTDSTFYPQKPVQVDSSHNLRKPVQTDSTFYLQKPVQADSSHNLRRAVEVSDSHYLRWPTVRESDHDLPIPVQVHATYDLRKPVQTDSTFYLQKPVQVDSSHNLRKPVQTDSTFYLPKPVQVDSSHNLRRPVKIADSHDLRWPIVQEPDHDLRNPVADIDFFRSENAELNLDKIIQEYAKKTSKHNYNQENNDPIHELLHDEQVKSNCAHEFWSRNNSTTRNGTRLENQDVKTTQQKVLFRISTKDCGIPFSGITEYFDFQNRNSKLGPWMVSVQEYFFGKFRHKCGASLLNNLWVITAAHCVDLRPKWDFLLKLGTEKEGKSENSIVRFVNKISIHPKYNNINFDNDLALLRMELPVTYRPNVVPICLPDVHENMEKRKATIFGWQVTTRRKILSGATQAETVPVLTDKECEVMFSETGVNEGITKNFVCAGARSVKESCTGDSGGPLAVLDTKGRWSLAGLYSWGKTCKIPNQPEVYISISSYVNWIEDTIVCFEQYINLDKINN